MTGRLVRGIGETSLRTRLLVLAVLALLPLLLFVVGRAQVERDQARANAMAETRRLASLAAASQEQLLVATRDVLLVLAATPAVNRASDGECSAFLARLLPAYRDYANLGVADRAGNVVCSAIPLTAPVSIADRRYFRRAIETHDFALGEFQVGRIAGEPTLNAGYPLLDPDGTIRGVVYAAIRLSRLSQIAAGSELPPGATITLSDRNGTILARHPDPAAWVGRQLPETPLIRAMRDFGGGSIEAAGIDGVTRVYAFRTLAIPGTDPLHLSVGFESAALYATADQGFTIGLVGLGIVLALGLLIAWLGARALVLDPVRSLIAATERLAAGDLTARTGLAGAGGEIGRLARAFDEMAASVERRVGERTAELTRALAELEAARAAADEARATAEAARAAADQANRAKSDFLSRVSHELRTPLNAIIGFAQLLRADDLDPDQSESARQIERAGRHLLRLIDDLIDIGRIEGSRLPVSPEPVGVRGMIEEVAGLIAPLATGHGLKVILPDAAPESHVMADRQRLRQVLLNLLSNAVKYNRPGGTVRLTAEPAGADRLRITVVDEGPGLTPAQQARLFAPFDRLGAEASGVEGTGLGLALSKALAEQMGGRLGVDSTPGAGSAFWIELPIAAADVRTADEQPTGTAGPAAPGPSSGPAVARPAVGPSGTILHIEDNPSNLRLVERVLARRPNIRLVPAMLGQLGLELAREHHPDLILLDLHLPDLPGGELLARLRADPATRQIPIVVLSADARADQEERSLAAGARAHLTKPLDIEEFLALVDELLGQSHPATPPQDDRGMAGEDDA
ncbi:MAG: ATP-binding protein [Chloroflexota bacterium]